MPKGYKSFIPEDALKMLYVDEHLNSVEIAARYGITFPTVLRLLRNFGIPIRDSHDGLSHRDIISIQDLPSIISNPRHVEKKGVRQLVGDVTCPMCQKRRTLTLSTARIRQIGQRSGRCNACAQKTRQARLDIEEIKRLYQIEHYSTTEISRQAGVSVRTVLQRMKQQGIPIRTKGESHALSYQKLHRNNGTLDCPNLGDQCRGTDIGLNDPTYYVWVECPMCHHSRWQVKSHIKRSPLCRDCSLTQMGLTHSGPNAPVWFGGKSFEPYTYEFNDHLKEQIRQRDNYTCQLCGKPQNGKRLVVHHIDYDKTNNKPSNLISLCQSQKGQQGCHAKTNHRREYWTLYFKRLMTERGLLIVQAPQPAEEQLTLIT